MAFMFRVLSLALVALQASGVSLELRSQQDSQAGENPIRSVVRLLQKLSKSLIQEGKDEKIQYDKVMCSCKMFQESKTRNIALNEEELERLRATIEEKNQTILLLQADIDKATKLRTEAQQAIVAAETLRQQQHEEFLKNSVFTRTNVVALRKAVKAVEDGHAGKFSSFLQSESVSALRKLSISADLSDRDRDVLGSFLSTGSKDDDGDDYTPSGEDYAPQSGEILGILKQLYDDEKKDLDEMEATEAEQVKALKELVDAKQKEIAELTAEIDEKSQRRSALMMELTADMAKFASGQEILEEDKAALKESEKVCKERDETYQHAVENRLKEIAAIADAVRMLNADDALELFKKSSLDKPVSTQPVSMLQTAQQSKMKGKAEEGEMQKSFYYRLNLLSVVIKHKAVDFSNLHTMIKDQVTLLTREEVNDNKTKTSCEDRKKAAEDEKIELEAEKKRLQGELDASNEKLAFIQQEIDYAKGNLSALNETLIIRRHQRLGDHNQYLEETKFDRQAQALIESAMNRLYKFYNPEKYTAGDDEVASDSDSTAGADFSQVSEHYDPGEVKKYKKSDQFQGIEALLEQLVTDLKQSLATSRVNDDNDQQDFESFETRQNRQMQNYIDQITNLKEEQADELQNNLQLGVEFKTCEDKLEGVIRRIADLKHECDWFLANYKARLDARRGEIQGLKDAKAFFESMGASASAASFLQTKSRRFLSR